MHRLAVIFASLALCGVARGQTGAPPPARAAATATTQAPKHAPAPVMSPVVATTKAVTSPTPTTAASLDVPLDPPLDYGADGLSFPPLVYLNGHTDRTAQLLGEAYRRRDRLVWKRVQYVAELGVVALPAGSPFIMDAAKDLAPQVRAQAARSAAMIGDVSLLPAVSKLLSDEDTVVRREAVLATASLAQANDRATDAIALALADKEAPIIAAALAAAWTPAHADLIAARFATLPPVLDADAALALARLKATRHAPLLVPLLKGDVAQRVAGVRALGDVLEPAQQSPANRSAIARMLADPHPTVRREAITAIAKLAAPASRESAAREFASRESAAIRMLADADFTVRQAAAAAVLAPVPSTEAMTALAAQLDVDYPPLHEAVRRALQAPSNPDVRAATIALAARMLAHANPRRREDASYLLGRLRSDAAIERHLALLQWDAANPARSDWPLIEQAADSLGRIGHAGAIPALMALVTPAPAASEKLPPPQNIHMANAMGEALAALARLRHRPALPEAVRILQLDPQTCPKRLRAAAAFAIGVLPAQLGSSDPPRPPAHVHLTDVHLADVSLLGIYENSYEDAATKFEALKALGNLKHAASAARLRAISESDLNPELRWIAHWSSMRAGRASTAYIPPTIRRAASVSITHQP